MADSTARLTCYAILSAIEDDLRTIASTHLAGLDSELVLGGAYPAARDRATRDLGIPADALSLADLVRYLDFQDAYTMLNRNAASLPTSYASHISQITKRLNPLVAVRNRVAHARPLDYEDFSLTVDLARELARRRDFPWDGVREVLDRLAQDPSFVLGLDINFPAVEQDAHRHNLPIPEYDETGFVGRNMLVRTLSQQLKSGPFPVVSIVGDGGIGKTSLALKVAYEILESESCPFESIVWVSAKTQLLTPREIVRIEGAITDSLGMLSAAADAVGAPDDIKDPMVEVLEYLSTFKILLILDNLETVLDERLRDFLSKLPTGSKVLITSRIGVGAYEHPIRLGPLEQGDGVKLLRALARLRNVELLMRLQPEAIRSLVDRMGGRPLYIRWFVQAVQAGTRPEEILQNSHVLLDYCMSNVYQFLMEPSKVVLRALQALPGPHSQAELAFLTRLEVKGLQEALAQLTNNYFVDLQTDGSRTAPDTQYQVTEFALRYLDKHHPILNADRGEYAARQNALLESGRHLQREHRANRYDPRTLDIRGSGDFNVAKQLINALSLAYRKLFAEAHELVDDARALAPGFHEVHRVEGHIYGLEHRYNEAWAAYERALELASDNGPMHYFAGMFLAHQGDAERGLGYLQNAARLDPGGLEPSLAVARAHLQLGGYQEARDVAGQVLKALNPSNSAARQASEFIIRAAVAQAQQAADDSDWPTAVGALQELVDALPTIPMASLDSMGRDKLTQARMLADVSQRHARDPYVNRAAITVLTTLSSVTLDDILELEQRSFGRIRTLVHEKAYGFIRETGSTRDFFFHLSDLSSRGEWVNLMEGVGVSFVPDLNGPKGPHARRVKLTTV